MTQSDAVTGIEKVADRYIAVWNESDAESRRQEVAALWTEDGTYTDPLAAVEGHEAIAAVIIGVREQFPGLVFRLLGDIDSHHDVARFGWELVPEGGGGLRRGGGRRRWSPAPRVRVPRQGPDCLTRSRSGQTAERSVAAGLQFLTSLRGRYI